MLIGSFNKRRVGKKRRQAKIKMIAADENWLEVH